MPTDGDADSSAEPRTRQPLFVIPQPDGISISLDFATPGPFGDLAFTARRTGADGAVRERVYGAHHTEEATIFVEILQHWARIAEPDDILAGLDRAGAVLRFLTDGLAATARSENDFSDLLRRGVEPLAVMYFLPVDHEHSDERGETIVLSSRGTDLVWISRRRPRTTFTVPPSHLWAFVTGMMWRTYDHDSIPLSRLNTVAYESALASFRAAIRSRSGTIPESDPTGPDGAVQHENRLGTPELVQRLCDLLGTKLVAYLSSVADTRTLRAWADPTDPRSPPDDVIDRLRIAYQVASLLRQKDSAPVIQAWFQGRNPYLGDAAPARLIRESDANVAGANVLAAARAFAASPERRRGAG